MMQLELVGRGLQFLLSLELGAPDSWEALVGEPQRRT